MTPRSLIATTCLLIAALAIACGGDDGGDDDAPTPTVEAPSATETPPAEDIREVDLEGSAPVTDLVTETGGTFVPESVLYADVTADGIDEAIVPLSSGGTLGDIAYVVLTPAGGGEAAELLADQPDGEGGIALRVEDGDLVVSQAVYGPTDPNCCPSQLRERRYTWDGSTLALSSDETIDNPAGAKTPT